MPGAGALVVLGNGARIRPWAPPGAEAPAELTATPLADPRLTDSVITTRQCNPGWIIGSVSAFPWDNLITGASAVTASLGAVWLTGRHGYRTATLALAADHARWLRDKRSEVYVELVRFVQRVGNRRLDMIREREVTEDLEQEARELLNSYGTQPLLDLLALAQTYASEDAGDAFLRASEADLAVWRLVSPAMPSRWIVMTDDLVRAMDFANETAQEFWAIIRKDLAVPDPKLPRRRAGGSRLSSRVQEREED